MHRLILPVVASAALAGAAHATTYAGAVPAATSEWTTPANIDFVTTSNVQRMAMLGAFQVGNGRSNGPQGNSDPGFGRTSNIDPPGGGEPLAGIPEPAVWSMLIAGFGLVGLAARRRKGVLAA